MGASSGQRSMSSIDQMPRAVVPDVTSISGMCPWCTVVTSFTAPRTKSAMAVEPLVTPVPSVRPSRISPDTSIVASGANTAANPSQSLVSIQRKYRAFSCLMSSMACRRSIPSMASSWQSPDASDGCPSVAAHQIGKIGAGDVVVHRGPLAVPCDLTGAAVTLVEVGGRPHAAGCVVLDVDAEPVAGVPEEAGVEAAGTRLGKAGR